MGFVRFVDRSAVVGFCPSAPYYLAGSAASAIDLNFSTSSVLEVFRVDFSGPPSELPVAGAPVTIGERFHSIAWGKTGIDTKLHPLGLVAGGLEDGSVNLWDPNRIIQGSDVPRCTVAKLKKHTSAVRALDFNPNLPQFLATGSTEPELFMWDLTKPSIPVSLTSTQLPPVPTGTESDFTCTKWNDKVHQILASCTTSGKTIVQDMRRVKPVATLHDMSSSRRCSVLEWSPEKPTQVLVASEDDRTPTVQVWDLRNSASPLSELAGHSKGILSMSWSPHDSRLLLTCAKDSRTFCWNVQTAEIVGELPPLGAWHLHVQWSPITPGLFSVSSFDGKIGICSFNSMVGPPIEGDPYPGAVTLVPKWMERPGGLSFGFGGKLASVSHSEMNQQDTTGAIIKVRTSKIVIKQITLEAESHPKTDAFDAVIRSGDKDALTDYCRTKRDRIGGNDKETWEMLGLMFSTDAKRQLLHHLGFEDIPLPQDTVIAENGGDTTEPSSAVHQDSGVDAAQDFFENLTDESPQITPKPSIDIPRPKKTEMAPGTNEEELQKALLVKNYEGAIEVCLSSNRAADALIIAHVAGSSVFDRIMHKYMEQHPRPFMSLLSAVALNDFHKLIQSRNPADWRETLAMLVAHVDDTDTWGSLCDALGFRLYQSGDLHGASLCFICSGNVEKAVSVWSSQGTGTLAKMQEIIEKAFVLGSAVPQPSASQSLCTIVHNYAQVLASQGSLQTALEYLDMIPGEPSESIQLLKDRIYGSGLVTKPEMTWTGDASTAVSQYEATSDYPSYPQESYQSGYGGGYSNTGAYDTGYGMQQSYSQPTPQAYVPPPQPASYAPQAPQSFMSPGQPPSYVHPQQPQQSFQSMPQSHTQQPALFTPQAPPPVAQPSVMQPSRTTQMFQPTATPAMPSHQPAAPPQASFMPTMPSAQPPVRPHVFNPTPAVPGWPINKDDCPCASGGAAPGSPVKATAPPPEPVAPHDISALNAETSQIPPQLKPIVTHLRGLFTKFESVNVAPSQKRIVADASKRVGLLFWDLNRGKIPPVVAQKVLQYTQALSSGDINAASTILGDLMENAWDEASSHWLSSFKRIIRLAQTIK